MKIRTLGVAMIGSLALTGVAIAGPGPNGNNTYGLCTAYFAGSAKGQEMKRKAPPFQGLERAAEGADQSVEEYCAENGQRPGGKPSTTSARTRSGGPGPNGRNDYGLCKAYFAGSERGREQKRKAPPFRALEAAAEAEDKTVAEYCADKTPGGRPRGR